MRPLGALGRFWGAFQASLKPLGRLLNDLGSILERFVDGLGGTWEVQDLKIIVFLRLPRL